MIQISKTTEIRYVKLWNRLQALNFDLKDLNTITAQEFNRRIGQKGSSEGQYRLAKSLARNIERQKTVNTILTSSNIPTTIIRQIPQKVYIPSIQKKPIQKKVKPKSKPVSFNPSILLQYFQFENRYDIKNQPSGFAGKISFVYGFKEKLKKIGLYGFTHGDTRINNFMTEIKKMIKTDLFDINFHFHTLFKTLRLYNTAFTFRFELYDPKTKKYDPNETLGQKTCLCGSPYDLIVEQEDKLDDIEKRFNLINFGRVSQLLYHIYSSKIIIAFYFTATELVQLP